MKYRLENKARVYSDESLSALLRAVLTTHCPYRRCSGYHVNVTVRKAKASLPYARVTSSAGFEIELHLPAPLEPELGMDRVQLRWVVGALRWAVMYIAEVPAEAWPGGDPPYWPEPKWFGKLKPLEPFRPQTPEQLAERVMRQMQQQLKQAETKLKQARAAAKRAATNVKAWENRVAIARRALDREDKRFLKGLNNNVLNRAMLDAAKQAMDELEAAE